MSSLTLVYSANTGRLWARSVSDLRSLLHAAGVELSVKRSVTRSELEPLLSGLPIVWIPNVGPELDAKAIRKVELSAAKAARVHATAKARVREAACGHRNCSADGVCRWAA